MNIYYGNIYTMTRTKIFTLAVLLFSILLFSCKRVLASEPTFSFYPDGGSVVNNEEGFTVDILIDSAGEKLVSARFVVTFDPQYLKLKKAEKNNILFEQWPDDESSIDNENGVAMLTGFTQSGSGNEYITQSKPDVMARLTFDIIKPGDTTLNWEFSGENETFKSVMLKDGSPPVNILESSPKASTFKIGEKGYNPIYTAIPVDRYILVGGVVLVLFGALMLFAKPRSFTRGKGTVVMYEK